MKTYLLLYCLVSLSAFQLRASGPLTVSLDGEWQVADSISASDIPQVFTHKSPVPGLANLARPAFKEVDQFDSQELIANRVRKQSLPESARTQTPGVSRQDRNYFWYQTDFHAPSAKAVATLRINKAQFGTAVWLNGQKLGEYSGCFSAGIFALNEAIRWNAENQLLIRIGAHPGVLPVSYPAGTDFEKLKWTPGIYDSVSVHFCDNPVIEWVQVAPQIASSEVLVQTRLKNYGPSCSVSLEHRVRPAKGGKRAPVASTLPLRLEAGEERIVTEKVSIPGARLWSPESPYLYVLETTTGGDSLTTRFGMREFRGDAQTKTFFLNGKPYYLRGSNITLHRFFEDPNCGNLPWNEKWVRRLLVEIPRKMHWNSFRFCIGPVPDKWLEIADEAGLLIQNEFFVWTGAPDWDRKYARHWDETEMKRQYADWMRDNWNHPSVAIWDANNETLDPIFGEKLIPSVRQLDISNRPWENSYNPPVAPDDPIEHHPYLFYESATGDALKFRLTDLEKMDGKASAWHLPKEPHPILINEYGWLWLNRDGSPTLLTDKLYPRLLGSNATAQDRFAFDAYALAAKTEFWRASREYAGVLHFVYLTCSYPGVYTSDHFLDVKHLQLEPYFADYMAQAFQPLGVYLNFFQPILSAGSSRSFTVKMVNDRSESARGELSLVLETSQGRTLARSSTRFQLDALGRATFEVPFTVPNNKAKCVLKAVARPDGGLSREPTVCRRWVDVQ